MIYIHRGKIFKNIRENSYKGFRLCINNGLNIETDIHFIKDDTPVCYHDFDLRRINRIKTKKDRDNNVTHVIIESDQLELF